MWFSLGDTVLTLSFLPIVVYIFLQYMVILPYEIISHLTVPLNNQSNNLTPIGTMTWIISYEHNKSKLVQVDPS